MLLKVSLVLFFGIFVDAQDLCSGPNEAWNDCGSYCNQKCGEIELFCEFECTPDCFCVEGHRRNSLNICVPEEECDVRPQISAKTCSGINEFYTNCGNNCTDQCHSNEKTCRDTECQAGCFCRNGYKRNSAGICVPPKQCFCNDETEEYKAGDRCCESCEQIFCTQKYEIGCFCKAGLKRDPKTGKCVLPEKCPKSIVATLYCKENEELKCSNKCLELPKDEQGEGCTKECYYDCFCKEGFVRDSKTKKCVVPKKHEGYYLIPQCILKYVPFV
ncbi:mucin-6-like [Culicoides brevitarsis]|uniref:mucin-6-like n=1 Tax=Culicoides brevitarsis TaxID=469753 RepID=UPI00307C5FD3